MNFVKRSSTMHLHEKMVINQIVKFRKKHYFENSLENCCIIYQKLSFKIYVKSQKCTIDNFLAKSWWGQPQGHEMTSNFTEGWLEQGLMNIKSFQ